MPLYQWISGIPFSHAYYGTIRHSITVGFVSLFLMGISIQIFPPHLRSSAGHHVAFFLINIGSLLRITLQILTDWTAQAYILIAVSGVSELIGFLLFGGCLASSIASQISKTHLTNIKEKVNVFNKYSRTGV